MYKVKKLLFNINGKKITLFVIKKSELSQVRDSRTEGSVYIYVFITSLVIIVQVLHTYDSRVWDVFLKQYILLPCTLLRTGTGGELSPVEYFQIEGTIQKLRT